MPILPSHSKSYSLEAQLRVMQSPRKPRSKLVMFRSLQPEHIVYRGFWAWTSLMYHPDICFMPLCSYSHESQDPFNCSFFSFEKCPVYCFSLYRGQNPRPKSRWKFSPDNSLLNYKKMTSWHICNHPATTNRCKIIFGLTTSQLSNSPV